jgi:membrane-bound serine protease (ClpP class)
LRLVISLRGTLVASCLCLLPWLGAFEASASDGAPIVDVVEVSGPIDRRLVSFVEDAVTNSEAVLVVLQVDSTAAVDEHARRLVGLVADPPVPVAVWVGPEPARAYGAAAQILAAAPIRGAAPGVVIGYMAPTIAGTGETPTRVAEAFPEVPEQVLDDRVEVEGPVGGIVDIVSPSIGQFIVGLDGVGLVVRGEAVTLATARVEVADDGAETITPSVDVRFRKPGLIDRTLRLAVQPETAFLFLVAGLALVVFEFYAAGPGIAAGVGVAALLIAGYGLAVLPVNWWAVAASVVGVGAYTVDFQRNDLGWRSLLGTALLAYGGLRLVEAGPQMGVLWWPVALIIAAAALWFGVALTTVVRSRFSTVTIGREYLVGRTGRAESALDPEGVVVVDGARWRARARRATQVSAGDYVVVTAVDGIVLDVEPPAANQ